ncbi:N-alpha-acetyltransferase 50 [Daldinia childiae]|uniref:N-alpha-acetyltransferase 50 n=1 Tax=Daldinia childiae TaxID=326645 RepID=UPI001446DB3D|nr:N-alpha-acetyltransferase 50 [Daldinia childiae]KAF3054823.1 N-alpha-acetyltransferase 50 [Daldinia childiae]
MSFPSTNANGQSSIRNFFQPKTPSYVQPPAVSRTQAAPLVPPPPPSVAAAPSPTIEQNGPRSPLSPVPTTALSTRPPSLHPQATISPILPEHVPALRRITSLLLPVNYPDSFYARLSDPLSSGAFSRVVLWSDPSDSNGSPKVVGGLVCRPEPSPFTSSSSRKPSSQPITPSSQPNALYIQSLVLLSPYRQQGLAAALLDDVVRAAVTSPFACEEVYAHVWTDNEDGLRWYLARGFTKHGQVNGYYFKLRPDSAWIVRRNIGPVTSALGLNGAAASSSTGMGTTIPPSTTAAAANLLSQQAPTPPAIVATSGTGTLSAPPRSNGPSPNRGPGAGGLSFQNARPEMEWNDLPADMHGSRAAVSGPASNASSRSSSTAPRKKKDRAYPAAAFGK